MKTARIMVLSCIISFALGLILLSHAQPSEEQRGNEGRTSGYTIAHRPQLEGERFVGIVSSTDTTKGILVVSTWRGETAFDASTAKFGGHVRLEDMKRGERVMVRYVEQNGRKVARAVITAAHESSNGDRPRGN